MTQRASAAGQDAFAPLLICANLQKQQSSAHQGGADEDLQQVLTRCASLLAQWRARRCPVAHLKRIARPFWFDPRLDQCDWIDGVKPCPGDLVFEHALPSAYSSSRFAEYARNVRPSPSFVIGCSLDE